uniref:F-box domain-containing protein n=1 Tax=Mycena chlorophos TaxID=658473 RepID=A0ABQ0L1T3_MYCCL|nr:predicted protein [Mycena chlorophos]
MATAATRRITRGAVIAGRVPALPSIRDLTASTNKGGAFLQLNPVDLPPEVVSLICEEVCDRETLAYLCRTSRAFLSIAQHALYQTVELEDLPESSIMPFFLAVAHRSHLAARVHSLTVQIPPGRAMRQEFAEKFATALRVCVNLKDLAILCRKNALPNTDTDHTWIFDYCQFHLTTFVNSYFEFGRKLLPFLEGQSQLRVLVANRGLTMIHPEIFSPPRMPNLVAVCGYIKFLSKERPLERIETSLVVREDIAVLPIFGHFSATLTTLNLLITQRLFPAEVMRQVSGLCPALRHFVVRELHTSNPRRTLGLAASLPENPTYLMAFTQLETFAFILVAGSNERGDASLKAAARMVADACPTLRRVVVGNQHRGSCMAARTVVGGMVTLTEGKRVTLDDVSMFWE